MYEGVKSEMLSTTKFDENSDLSTTYLGRTDMTTASKTKAEEKFSISEHRVYSRKAIRCYGMSDTLRHGSKQIHLCPSHIF